MTSRFNIFGAPPPTLVPVSSFAGSPHTSPPNSNYGGSPAPAMPTAIQLDDNFSEVSDFSLSSESSESISIVSVNSSMPHTALQSPTRQGNGSLLNEASNDHDAAANSQQSMEAMSLINLLARATSRRSRDVVTQAPQGAESSILPQRLPSDHQLDADSGLFHTPSLVPPTSLTQSRETSPNASPSEGFFSSNWLHSNARSSSIPSSSTPTAIPSSMTPVDPPTPCHEDLLTQSSMPDRNHPSLDDHRLNRSWSPGPPLGSLEWHLQMSDFQTPAILSAGFNSSLSSLLSNLSLINSSVASTSTELATGTPIPPIADEVKSSPILEASPSSAPPTPTALTAMEGEGDAETDQGEETEPEGDVSVKFATAVTVPLGLRPFPHVPLVSPPPILPPTPCAFEEPFSASEGYLPPPSLPQGHNMLPMPDPPNSCASAVDLPASPSVPQDQVHPRIAQHCAFGKFDESSEHPSYARPLPTIPQMGDLSSITSPPSPAPAPASLPTMSDFPKPRHHQPQHHAQVRFADEAKNIVDTRSNFAPGATSSFQSRGRLPVRPAGPSGLPVRVWATPPVVKPVAPSRSSLEEAHPSTRIYRPWTPQFSSRDSSTSPAPNRSVSPMNPWTHLREPQPASIHRNASRRRTTYRARRSTSSDSDSEPVGRKSYQANQANRTTVLGLASLAGTSYPCNGSNSVNRDQETTPNEAVDGCVVSSGPSTPHELSALSAIPQPHDTPIATRIFNPSPSLIPASEPFGGPRARRVCLLTPSPTSSASPIPPSNIDGGHFADKAVSFSANGWGLKNVPSATATAPNPNSSSNTSNLNHAGQSDFVPWGLLRAGGASGPIASCTYGGPHDYKHLNSQEYPPPVSNTTEATHGSNRSTPRFSTAHTTVLTSPAPPAPSIPSLRCSPPSSLPSSAPNSPRPFRLVRQQGRTWSAWMPDHFPPSTRCSTPSEQAAPPAFGTSGTPPASNWCGRSESTTHLTHPWDDTTRNATSKNSSHINPSASGHYNPWRPTIAAISHPLASNANRTSPKLQTHGSSTTADNQGRHQRLLSRDADRRDAFANFPGSGYQAKDNLSNRPAYGQAQQQSQQQPTQCNWGTPWLPSNNLGANHGAMGNSWAGATPAPWSAAPAANWENGWFPPAPPSFVPPAPVLGTSSLPLGTLSLPFRTTSLPFTSGMGTSSHPLPPVPNMAPMGTHPNFYPPAPFTMPQTFNPTASMNNPNMGHQWLSNPYSATQAHPRFSFTDANVTFSVQNKEYRVHRYFFEQHSSFFKQMLSSYPTNYLDPIVLSASQVDFERLLTLFYPLSLAEPNELTTVEEWTSVLTLSNLWDFKQLRTRAIKELAAITTPVERILLSRVHNVKEWNLSAYKELCLRGRPVSLEEGEQLGVKTVIKIWDVETELRMRNHVCRGSCCEEWVNGIVKAKFAL